MVKLCVLCNKNRAVLKRPKTGQQICQPCFFYVFETEIHHTIQSTNLFNRGEKVAIGASGGKDSTVLAHIMKTLNDRYDYGLDLYLLSVDEGITGYRDDSLETVKRNQQQYDLPLKIVSYHELYGWSMDEIVSEVGRKNNCTYCGVFRRQALDRGSAMLGIQHIVTGHNADDIAETILMNKCIYSPNAYRGYARTFLKDLEAVRPSAIIDIIHSGEAFEIKSDTKMPTSMTCTRCGYMSSNSICKACMLLEGLNRGLPQMGIGKQSKAQKEQIEKAGTLDDSVLKVKHFSEIKVEDSELELIKPRDPKDVYTPPPRVPGGILHDAKLEKKDATW
ncbi:hypothetical protein G6F56_000130 [Rhizopus delemar]|nr:hypothetical protein G6F56_000130 [Rhizopus delemar]